MHGGRKRGDTTMLEAGRKGTTWPWLLGFDFLTFLEPDWYTCGQGSFLQWSEGMCRRFSNVTLTVEKVRAQRFRLGGGEPSGTSLFALHFLGCCWRNLTWTTGSLECVGENPLMTFSFSFDCKTPMDEGTLIIGGHKSNHNTYFICCASWCVKNLNN